jgi:hypothetical protein
MSIRIETHAIPTGISEVILDSRPTVDAQFEGFIVIKADPVEISLPFDFPSHQEKILTQWGMGFVAGL